MSYLRKYGTQTIVLIPMIKAGAIDFAASGDWTPAAGDVQVSKDEGAFSNITTLPTAVGTMWKFTLSATEMQAARVVVQIIDSATKAVEDNGFAVDTYGNASAEHAVDLDDSVRAGLTALPNAAADAAGGLVISDAGGFDIDNRAPAAASVMNMNTVFNTDFATNYNTTNDGWVVKLGDYAHGGTAAVLTLERLIAASTTTNEPAVKLTGNGTASGLLSTGGATGSGAKLVAGGAAYNGLVLTGGASGVGLSATAITCDGSFTIGSNLSVTGNYKQSGTDLFDASGRIVGIQGTITTLDALDTAQDTQHSTTQSAISALNDLSAAQVNAEVDTALADIHLDHLLAVDYDPAAKPGTATALLNELIESDAGVSRFTANALEQAPTGGGTPQTGDAYAYLVSNLGAAGASATEAGGTGDQLTALATAANLATAQADLDIITGTDGVTLATSQPNYAPNTVVPDAAGTAATEAEVIAAIAAYDAPTKAEMDSAFTEIKGATWSAVTDTLEAIRDRGDAAWLTATGFSTHSAADVRSEIDANSTQLAAILDDTDLIDDATSGLAKIATDVAAVLVDTATTIPGTITTLQGNVTSILADTNELQTDWANGGRLDLILDELTTQGDTNETKLDTITTNLATAQVDLDTITDTGVTCVALTSAAITDVWSTDALVESYAADGAAGTPAQILYLTQQAVTEFAISGTTKTIKKLDGSTTAATETLDDATSPTSITRAT